LVLENESELEQAGSSAKLFIIILSIKIKAANKTLKIGKPKERL